MDEAPPGVHCCNIDICETAVQMMRQRQTERLERLAKRPQQAQRKKNASSSSSSGRDSEPVILTYEVMDACNMSYEDEEFDVVFEKGNPFLP
jgi:hypothetical protein